MVDIADKLSRMESRVKAYLEERYPKGYSVETREDFLPCHVRFEVRSPGGETGPTLILPGEFVDYEDKIEHELDSRNVMSLMASAGKGNVVVPKTGSPVVESEH